MSNRNLANLVRNVPLRVSVPLAAITYVLGLIGFYEICPMNSVCGAETPVLTFLSNGLRAFSLFLSVSDPPASGQNNVPLAIARLAAPTITLFAIFRLSFSRLNAWRNQRKLSAIYGHTLVIGCGNSARHFISKEKDKFVPNVIVDRSIEALSTYAQEKGLLQVLGDGRSTATLERSGVGAARKVLVLGGSDEENLEIVDTVCKLWRKSTGQLNIVVKLKNQFLADQLEREDGFVRPIVVGGNVEVLPINIDRIAAEQFFSAYPLVDLADLRGQKRVHLVMVGWNDFALEVVEQLVRLSPFKEFIIPRITLFVESAQISGSAIKNLKPVLTDGTHVELRLQQLESGATIPSDDQIKMTEHKAEEVTAILITHTGDDLAAAAALALRKRTQGLGFWYAPVFVRLRQAKSIEAMFRKNPDHWLDTALQIVPVGQDSSTHDIGKLLGAREELAKSIHSEYLRSKRLKGGTIGPADVPWNHLPQAIRRANRRAADHAHIKILSSGFIKIDRNPRLSGHWSATDDAQTLEKLAELEHRSWEIDRRLDGWRFGNRRDEDRLLHPALRPYRDLVDDIKEYDRAQVQLLAQTIYEEAVQPNVRRDVFIGVFGRNLLSNSEESKITTNVEALIQSIVVEFRSEHISVATSLAPGSDTLITNLLLKLFSKERIFHRLLILQTLPWEFVLEEHLKNKGTDRKSVVASREEVLNRAGVNCQIVHLEPRGMTISDWHNRRAVRNAAHQKANAWLLDRCGYIICHLGKGQRLRPDGTSERLARLELIKLSGKRTKPLSMHIKGTSIHQV